MKELYTAPEAELLCLAANERLAATVDFDELLANQSVGTGVSENASIDIDVKID